MGVTTIDATASPADPRLASPSSMAFFVGNPPQQMQIFTGTVAIHRRSDRSVEHETVNVILGSTTAHAQTTAKVDMASFFNSDSEFLFAIDANRVTIDPDTGLITLSTDLGVQGNSSTFERFTYQVQVLSDPVQTTISGTIRWAESLATPSPGALAGATMFSVDAGVFTTLPGGVPRMTNPTHGATRGVPVLAGGLWAVAYTIENVPLGPLNVVLPALLDNVLTNLQTGLTAGSFYFAPPTSIQLTQAMPSAVKVDFEMLPRMEPR